MAFSSTELAPAADFLPALLDLLHEGVVGYAPITDAGGEVVDFAFAYLNPAAQRILGLPAQPANTYTQQFPTSRANGGLAFHLAAYLAGGAPRQFELNYPADGYDRYFRMQGRRLGDKLLVAFTATAGQPRTAMEKDLCANTALAETQQRHLNEGLEARGQQPTSQLEAQQELLRQILTQVPASVATLAGPEHRFAFFNDRYLALAAGRAVLGRTVAEVLPEVVEQGFIGLLDQVYTTGQPFSGTETLAMLHDQATGRAEQRYIDFSYQPLHDDQGQIQGILAFILDVTDRVRSRKQAETLQAAVLAAVQRQAQQRQEIYEIFAQTPVAIVLLREPDHRIDYFNAAFETLFPPEEWAGPLHGHTIGEVYPRIKLAGLVALLDRVFATGEPQVVIEMPLADLQPGSPRYVTFSYQAYHEQGRIAGVAAFAYDVTEQVLARQRVQAANDELHSSNSQLSRINADLDTFVYSASHDLKSPITNIEGLLLALRQQLPPEALATALVPRLLDMMDGAVTRFQQTLGHLTNVSRLPQDLAAQPAEAVDLPALAESVRLDILPELAAAGATLTLDLAACPTLYFSPKTLRSILYNLLSNAVKYHDPARPAQVQLRCHCLPGQLVLEVQDNGLGLSVAQQSELFQLFRRLHTHVSGSGVGLYMVKKMVDSARGTLAVQSQPGVGSTFTVTLPAANQPIS